MKEKLIELSKEKGFKSVVKITSLYQIRYIYEGSDDVVDDYTGIIYYLWLCELQKYLREKHEMHITLDPGRDGDSYSFNLYNKSNGSNCLVYNKLISDGWPGVKTYEIALEKGLFEALKLIEL